MRNIRRFIIVICVTFIFGINVLAVHSITVDFDVAPLLGKEKAEAIDIIDLKLIHDDNKRVGIQCFDVSQNGLIALAFQSDSRCWIYVYNADGVFQYGFTFVSAGDFGIEFYQENIAIYFTRGDKIAIYDSKGNCIDIYQQLNQNLERSKEILNRSQKEVQGKQYILERDVALGDSYSRCVVIDDQEIRTVLYDVSTNHSIGQIARLVAIAGFFMLVIWGSYVKLKQTEE